MTDTNMVSRLRSPSRTTTKLVLRSPALRYDGYRFGIATSGIDSRPSRFARGVFGERKQEFSDRFGTGIDENLHERMTKPMVQAAQKNIRFTPGQWKRVEKEAEMRGVSANRLVVELTMEALEGREWPRTEAEIHLLRSAMFAAQAIIRGMERTGREEEIEQISRNISEVAPELPPKSAKDLRDQADSGSVNLRDDLSNQID